MKFRYLTLVLVLAGCATPGEDVPAASPGDVSPPELAARPAPPTIRVSLPPVQRVGIRIYCANGEEPYGLSVDVCQEPREGACTTYYCPDPGGGRPILAIVEDANGNRLPNPLCRYAQMQTEPCKERLELGERDLPTPRQWHELLPHVFGDEMIAPEFGDGEDPGRLPAP